MIHQRKSLGHSLICFKKRKKETQGLEIMFRGVLRRSRPARSKVRVNISNPQSPFGHPTPLELRDRSIWKTSSPKFGEIRGNPSQVCRKLDLVDWLIFAKNRIMIRASLPSESSSGHCECSRWFLGLPDIHT